MLIITYHQTDVCQEVVLDQFHPAAITADHTHEPRHTRTSIEGGTGASQVGAMNTCIHTHCARASTTRPALWRVGACQCRDQHAGFGGKDRKRPQASPQQTCAQPVTTHCFPCELNIHTVRHVPHAQPPMCNHLRPPSTRGGCRVTHASRHAPPQGPAQ